MRTVVRFIIFLVLSISIGTAVLPMQSAVPQIEKSSCCSKADDEQDDCSQQMPRSQQEQQCCSACAIGLALFLDRTTILIVPPAGDESFATYTFALHFRSERPPVPPPRLPIV